MRERDAIFLFVASFFIMTLAWDPDAGLVKSLTKQPGTQMFASSRQDANEMIKANDGNDGTYWMSWGCMPGGFYTNNELSNVFYQACQRGRCQTTSTALSEIYKVTDDNVNTAFVARLPGGGGDARFSLSLASRDSLRYITVKGQYNAPTDVVVVDGSSETVVRTLTTADNYQTRDINVTLTPATSVTFRSSAEFSLFSVAALGSVGCLERIYVDMGAPKSVRVVRTRHWPGKALSSALVTSLNGVTWQTLRVLDPSALKAVVTTLDSPVTVRYIGVQHRGEETNWAKVYVWEIDAYDDSGPFGGAPTPTTNPISFRSMLGVNGIWGWGTNKYSNLLGPGEGPALYAPVASYARNYHNLNWDVTDPDHVPDFEAMAQGHGTEAQWWLNWDREYRAWVANNVSVHVSVQFSNSSFPVSVWNQPRTAAFNYGQAFARHFGPTNGTGLVRSVEVGNEPWDYPADFYRTILEGMASGFKAGDPNMVVMPGAFQANDPTSTGNYIGTRVTADVMDKIDVINSHHYSWRNHEDGSRHATHPEDPAGSFNEVRSIVRWRNANTPSKPLWMTEWGWDSPGVGQDCTKFPECTTELAASAYAARGLLLHARLGVARSTWFFYGNLDDCDTHVFCRSGLTSSKSASFAKKGPYYTLQHFLQLAGDKHFLSVIREDSNAYVFLLGDLSSQTPTHLVAWRPVDAALDTAESSVTFNYNLQPARAWKLSMTSQQGQTTSPTVQGNEWTMTLSVFPTVVELS